MSTITTNTRKYLRQDDTQKILVDAALKMAKIELTKRRQDRGDGHSRESSWSFRQKHLPSTPPVAPVRPGAVELPADDTMPQTPPQHYRTPGNPPYPNDTYTSSQDKFVVTGQTTPPRLSADLPYRGRDEKIVYQPSSHPSAYNPSEPPPRPPKTPINEPVHPAYSSQHVPPTRPNGAPRPPYPDYGEGPPPIVSKLRKPEYTPR